jgi:hypothetical protein
MRRHPLVAFKRRFFALVWPVKKAVCFDINYPPAARANFPDAAP